MWLAIVLGIGGALILGVIIFILVWKIRTRNFRPNPDKAEQQRQINRDLEVAGFAYDRRGDVFYSRLDCWQREMGYCRLYDEAASGFSMVMHCEPIPFAYAGKRWLIELWKGQYGLTTGGEIGIYNTDREDVASEKFTGTFYECAQDDECLPLSFVLRRDGRILLRRRAVHWWLTGFRLGAFSDPDSLTMDARIRFPNRDMCQAFVDGLTQAGYRRGEYRVRGNTVTIRFDKPHTDQPASQTGGGAAIAQQVNKTNCQLFETVTRPYADTLDRLEYLKAAMPDLYAFCMNSLYAKELYEGFGWLLNLARGGERPVAAPSSPGLAPCPLPCPPAPPCVPGHRERECFVLRPLPGTADGVMLCPIPCPPNCPCECRPRTVPVPIPIPLPRRTEPAAEAGASAFRPEEAAPTEAGAQGSAGCSCRRRRRGRHRHRGRSWGCGNGNGCGRNGG